MKLASLFEGGVPSRRLGLMFQHVAEEEYDEELDVFVSDGFTIIYSKKITANDLFKSTGIATDGRNMWYVNADNVKAIGAKAAIGDAYVRHDIPQVSELETIAWIKREIGRWTFE